jgi:hypothetical protein
MKSRISEARKTLGISKSSTKGEVKKRYRELVKKWHPDVNKTEEAGRRIKQINKAFETVMKGVFDDIDPWEDYHKWWLKQYGNDPIWGNYDDGDEEKKSSISHKRHGKK